MLDYPTCGDVGLGVYACKVCDETKENEISATGTRLWTTLDTLEATCYSKGYVTRNCAVCDTTETIELPATEEHIFNESKWVYVNVTVVRYTTDISLPVEALPLVLDTEPIKYIVSRIKHSED